MLARGAVCYVLCKVSVGPDGRTLCERRGGKQASQDTAEIREKAQLRVSQKGKPHADKLEAG